ncbi:hypothetical protein A946_00190 [Methylacidiphilum kamchatkense Kam1]|uniref:Secreted protein n=1 Tax=Methylacidiphilum kamchatkense Kam1 TaxID=1202785 RepID=A0ABR4ZYI9_9BACT|nr:hypothetical protein A946_00190 [Methylacidiphilum kamchatkense Kam1]
MVLGNRTRVFLLNLYLVRACKSISYSAKHWHSAHKLIKTWAFVFHPSHVQLLSYSFGCLSRIDLIGFGK